MPYKGYLEDIEYFDAQMFGYTPIEATILNPNIRLLLSESYQALNNASYDPFSYEGKIGFFSSCGQNNYIDLIEQNNNLRSKINNYQLKTSNYNDFLSTTVAYKLNLKGPAITIQTACSSSLVAMHTAIKAIRNNECEIAIAAGVSIDGGFGKSGYTYQEGMIHSKDGKCRPFDENASGTVAAQGVGVVILKSLSQAKKDHDNILAVVKGSAINNDGNKKVSFTAPSISGQINVLEEALFDANVESNDISYIETHGTATKVGDPIEIEALKSVYRGQENICAIGSVKSNIGHTDTAAGIVSVIKTVLCLKNKTLVPTLNFETLNHEISLDDSPLYVNNETKYWDANRGLLHIALIFLNYPTKSHMPQWFEGV